MITRGQRALEVYQALYFHMLPANPYDGFKYNFRLKKCADVTSLPRQNSMGFSMVERDNTDNVTALLKVFYPLFAMNKYAPKLKSSTFFIDVRTSQKQFQLMLEGIKERLADYEEPPMEMGMGGLPRIYYMATATSVENYFLVVALFLKFPALNSITCSDPLGLYAEFKTKLDLHKRLFSLYM